MFETGEARVVAACCAEGRTGTSGLPRGDVESESASGEPKGLLASESSAMAGYGGVGRRRGRMGGGGWERERQRVGWGRCR